MAKLLALLISFLSFALPEYANSFTCNTEKGITICVSFVGQSPISSIIPGETTPLKIGIFHVKIENRSGEVITLSPFDFYCSTLLGNAILVDEALYNKINWQAKLEKKELPPGGSVEGYLFFPILKDIVRSIVYRGSVIIEIRLF